MSPAAKPPIVPLGSASTTRVPAGPPNRIAALSATPSVSRLFSLSTSVPLPPMDCALPNGSPTSMARAPCACTPSTPLTTRLPSMMPVTAVDRPVSMVMAPKAAPPAVPTSIEESSSTAIVAVVTG